MPFHALLCPQCGAPLPPESKKVVVICGFCGVSVAWERLRVRAADFRRALVEAASSTSLAPRLLVAGRAYDVLGHLAEGESTSVLLAEWAHRTRERVLIKVLTAQGDVGRLDHEWSSLTTLHALSVPGAARYLTRLPQPVARGSVTLPDTGALRPATVWRHLSGFGPTFEDLRRRYPGGLDPRHAVWLWRRGLDTLGFAHGAGYCHGAVLPQHLVVHPRDHGVLVVGWSWASRPSTPLSVVCKARQEFYGGAETITPALDCLMLARCIAYVLGADPNDWRLPNRLPAPLLELLQAQISALGPRLDAWLLSDRVRAVARQCFGAPAFVPLEVPPF